MINKRLLDAVEESKGFIGKVVALQLLELFANIASTAILIALLKGYLLDTFRGGGARYLWIVAIVVLILRFFISKKRHEIAYESSVAVKVILRERLFKKLMSFGASYKEKMKTAEAVQIISEGVDQLEIYFSAYVPQFFYSMIAPLILFAVIGYMSLKVAIILLIGVPLIPLAIVLVQKFAKKMFAKYWGRYTDVGDQFLENLQGLTTLKIYEADGYRHEEMNTSAEAFRVATMRVLTMQLNSIIIMDLVAFGGAAIALAACIGEVAVGRIDIFAALFILFLSADYFLPMRQLGSFFHVAMNGMAAADKMFALLDLSLDADGKGKMPVKELAVKAEGLSFSYEPEKLALKNISFDYKGKGLIGLVGPSGSGKSTLAALLSKQVKQYDGSLILAGSELKDTSEGYLLEQVTYLGAGSYLLSGTVKEALSFARADATEAMMWQVLKRVNLYDYFKENGGLESVIESGGSNLSGGQRQRLSLAMALLRESPIYIFDEVTSNIDVESESHIVEEINALAARGLVIFISHRLANIKNADEILVLDRGELKETGTHDALIAQGGIYAELWQKQASLEAYRGEGEHA